MKFDYIKLDEEKEILQEEFRLMFTTVLLMADLINDTRSKDYMLKRLEEAFMWATKGIRADQIEKNKTK